jgi:shikimate 5-dehydrogenase
MIEERGATCRQCLEAYVNGEREQTAKMSEEVDKFSVVINCIKPVRDKEQLSMSFTKDINSHPKPVFYESLYKPAPGNVTRLSPLLGPRLFFIPVPRKKPCTIKCFVLTPVEKIQ